MTYQSSSPRFAQCARICCLVICVMLVSCKRADLSRMHSSENMMITTNVWLHRTSGRMVTINDQHGMGLVNGNVKRIGYENRDRKHLLVAYIPDSSESPGTTEGHGSQTRLVRIDLNSGVVSSISDVDGSITRSLREITSFFPHE